MASPPPSRIDLIAGEFYAKALHIILEARIPSICSQVGRDSPSSSSVSTSSSSLGVKSRDRWFNIVLGDCSAAQASVEPWRGNPSEPMILDILSLPARVGTQDSWSGGEQEESTSSGGGTVLERWYISHERQAKDGSRRHGGSLEVPGIYKRAVILMRSLYCFVRMLPAHRLFNLSSSSSQSRSFSLSYRVSASPSRLSEAEEASMIVQRLTPVETPTGRMCISVAYRHITAMTALEVTPAVQPKIIADYVGSPTTDPLRRVATGSLSGSLPSGGVSGRREVHVVSVPASVPTPPLASRRHSWTGGLTKVPATLLPPTSPSYRSSRSPSPHEYHPSPPGLAYHEGSSYGLQKAPSQPIFIQDRRLSPPLLSSLSPSPPGSVDSTLARHVSRPLTAPVNIPKSSGFRGAQETFRNALPPPSPRRHPSAGREGQRLSHSALADSLQLVSPPLYPARQPLGDEKHDEGPPSGIRRPLYSSSRASSLSSRLNNQEEMEFACPFAVDEDEPEDSSGRSGSFEGSGPKSQQGAVGALVRMLQEAAPLHDRREVVNEVGPKLRGRPIPRSGSNQALHRYTQQQQQPQTLQQAERPSKRITDALADLRGFKEMQEYLSLQSGGRKCTEKQLPTQWPNVQ